MIPNQPSLLLSEGNLILIDYIRYASGFLFGPSLFLFCVFLSNGYRQFETADYWHGVPFVALLVLSISDIELNEVIEFILFNIHVFTYLTLCIITINRYRLRLKNYVSSTETLNLNWLYYVVGAFIFMWSMDFINNILFIFSLASDDINFVLSLLSVTINFLFVITIFYKTLNQPIFLFDTSSNSEKYKSSSLSNKNKSEIMEKINDFFKRKQPYLDATLTIKNVSASIAVPVKYISQVINELEQQNFYDFTNKHRIEHSKKLLKSNKTILDVLYLAGFNSKSAFNKAFKKHTGSTPSQYRKTPN